MIDKNNNNNNRPPASSTAENNRIHVSEDDFDVENRNDNNIPCSAADDYFFDHPYDSNHDRQHPDIMMNEAYGAANDNNNYNSDFKHDQIMISSPLSSPVRQQPQPTILSTTSDMMISPIISRNNIQHTPTIVSSTPVMSPNTSSSSPPHVTAWNSNVDWSRSTNDVSSDEESLPNSISSADLSHLDVTTAEEEESAALDEFRRQSQWYNLISTNPNVIPPYQRRQRAHTYDGVTVRPVLLRRNNIITIPPQIPMMTRHRHPTDSVIEYLSSASPIDHINMNTSRSTSPQLNNKNKSNNLSTNKRITPAGRWVVLLFMIATYTTFWLPYLEIPIPAKGADQALDDIVLMSTLVSTSTTSSSIQPDEDNKISITISDSIADDAVPAAAITTASSNVNKQQENHEPGFLSSSSTIVRSGYHPQQHIATFARRTKNDHVTKKRKFLRQQQQQEVADFYHQTAIQQQLWFLSVVPWHVHISILFIVALWFIIDYIIRKQQKQKQQKITSLQQHVLLSTPSTQVQ